MLTIRVLEAAGAVGKNEGTPTAASFRLVLAERDRYVVEGEANNEPFVGVALRLVFLGADFLYETRDGLTRVLGGMVDKVIWRLDGAAHFEFSYDPATPFSQVLSDRSFDMGMRIIDNGFGGFLDGGRGDDLLFGKAGGDAIVGLQGEDGLFGGNGADTLDGGSGADVMSGGAGGDEIRFGSGADVMTGGGGADRYVVRQLGHLGLRETRDTVTDFETLVDELDLRRIDADAAIAGDQAFDWIGGERFGGVAGELRIFNGILAGDLDGDARADFQIAFADGAALNDQDILF